MQPVLFLHGAIGAADQLQPLADKLSGYNIIPFNFSGHGGKDFPSGELSIKQFAEEVLAFIEEQKLEQVNIFGYSMGGYVGMYLAKHHPDKVKQVATLATKFHWDAPTAAKETQMLDADKIEVKVPAFAKSLQERHAPNDWKVLLQRTVGMLQAMGADNPLKEEDYTGIATPSLIMLGDKDKMVTLEETLAVYKALPNARMAMLPATHHPIEQSNTEALAFLLNQFFAN
ncbi:alpha/beta fold hydrolase [Polluticoccus soli]|uniref:alpha/beta fold hydrolase n=1 Tax=Polluticoccus soli TaxID=3034150 RepID=UPI0023E22C3B|nr:alpha/beta hydrolase [Flavipsychrobacter sp. JY13-12]